MNALDVFRPGNVFFPRREPVILFAFTQIYPGPGYILMAN